MARSDTEPSVRTHLWLFKSDLEWLQDTYGHNIGVSQAVRKLVRAYRRRIEARVADQQPQDTIPLESIGADQ